MKTEGMTAVRGPAGALALEYCNVRLPLKVLHSAAGYYLGTFDATGPVSRESEEYFRTEQVAQGALESGDWTQRTAP